MCSLKRIASLLGICSVLSVLGGCQQETSAPVAQQPAQPVVENDASVVETPAVAQKIIIHDSCIGCGKCARMASNTFTMEGRKATVYSQDHIVDVRVQQAIRHCPVSAIEVVDA